MAIESGSASGSGSGSGSNGAAAERRGWNSRQERAAIMLASGSTVVDAATATGAGVRTIHAWLDDPAYMGFVARLRDRTLSVVIGKLSEAATRAAAVMESLLEAESESVRLRAASAILDGMIRAREHGELAARVAELESRIGGNGGGSRA